MSSITIRINGIFTAIVLADASDAQLADYRKDLLDSIVRTRGKLNAEDSDRRLFGIPTDVGWERKARKAVKHMADALRIIEAEMGRRENERIVQRMQQAASAEAAE